MNAFDYDYTELMNDILATLPSTQYNHREPVEERNLLKYLDAFLSRFSRRVSKNYSAIDSFAAACVGARRLLMHLGVNQNSHALLAIERSLARAVAASIMDCDSLEDSVVQYGMDMISSTNPFANSIYCQYVQGRKREHDIDQISVNCLKRADEWSPEVAAGASQTRKRKQKRNRYLSLFIEVEAERQARDFNSLLQEPQKKITHAAEYTPVRKLSADETTNRDPKSSSQVRRPSYEDMYYQNKNVNSLVRRPSHEDVSYQNRMINSQSRRPSHEEKLKSRFRSNEVDSRFNRKLSSDDTSQPRLKIQGSESYITEEPFRYVRKSSNIDENSFRYHRKLSNGEEQHHERKSSLTGTGVDSVLERRFQRKASDDSSISGSPRQGIRTGEIQQGMEAYSSGYESRVNIPSSPSIFSYRSDIAYNPSQRKMSGNSSSGNSVGNILNAHDTAMNNIRRGSAEELLQSVLDECESLIDTLHVREKDE